ncbi:PEP-utilizing enzyme [Pseudonocardia spinosispora]|uniref:PEP-utilizing enzyme n=1 Tax=Pseudonocardia spinosispora TaxID=103441 RepID=UPI00056A3CAC|nr:PEP-utilizing enzyme [Pseudonocardia spinosispora]
MTDSWDVLNDPSDPGLHWTTGNIGEAVPGVQTPLSWSLWGTTIEEGMRLSMRDMGAFSHAESQLPPKGRQLCQVFYGRGALSVELLARLGDRMPGTTGQQVATGVYGEAPETIDYRPTKRRYPVVAAAVPYQMARIAKRLHAARAESERLWPAQTGGAASMDLAESLRVFSEATARFKRCVYLQSLALFCAVQPMYDALTKLTQKTGVGDPTSLASGYGGVPETEVVADLWRTSRGEIELAEVVRKHGFHGPSEGELSGRVWREDDSPLRRLVNDYANRPDDADPRLRDAARRDERLRLEKELLDAVPSVQRPAVKLLLRRAEVSIPLRGVSKTAFLQAFDVVRATARRAGDLLTDQGVLADPGDVFFLTDTELLGGPTADIQEVVTLRRGRHAEYLTMRLPEHWVGTPEPILLEPLNDSSERVRSITGVGVSAGVVEGLARVVTDPDFEDVESDEILVASTTDPSWSSIMFISSALVVDIGGALSHAAVVARELGIPCVVNTRDGSRKLRTGDLIRVDGNAGTVEILKPVADAQVPAEA